MRQRAAPASARRSPVGLVAHRRRRARRARGRRSAARAGHRAAHRAGRCRRRRCRRRVAARGQQVEARLVAEHAAEVRRHADRAADVASRVRAAPCRLRQRRARRRRTSRRGVRVRSRGLTVRRRSGWRSASRRATAARWSCRGSPRRRPSGAATRTASAVGHEVAERREAPGRRQAGDVVRLLDRHRHARAARRRCRTSATRASQALGLRAGAVEVADDDGVDRRRQSRSMRAIAASHSAAALARRGANGVGELAAVASSTRVHRLRRRHHELGALARCSPASAASRDFCLV